MSNREHSDEHVHQLPISESPDPYQNHNLNSIVWLLPLERKSRENREKAYKQLTAESEKLYQLVLLAKLQMQHKCRQQKQ